MDSSDCLLNEKHNVSSYICFVRSSGLPLVSAVNRYIAVNRYMCHTCVLRASGLPLISDSGQPLHVQFDFDLSYGRLLFQAASLQFVFLVSGGDAR